MKKQLIRLAALAAGLTIAATGCSLDSASNSSGNVVNVVIGYQSKTINTVTAGTLLKAQGYLERRLNDITTRTGTKYNVTWQDYDTGAPITAQMVAEKIDIGSMGDYPMLINGSKTQANERARTELVSVTGYNPKGALNMVVVKPDSSATTLADLAGTQALQMDVLSGVWREIREAMPVKQGKLCMGLRSEVRVEDDGEDNRQRQQELPPERHELVIPEPRKRRPQPDVEEEEER